MRRGLVAGGILNHFCESLGGIEPGVTHSSKKLTLSAANPFRIVDFASFPVRGALDGNALSAKTLTKR
jgi:hypothetical protein